MALNNFKCNRLMPLHFKGLRHFCSTQHTSPTNCGMRHRANCRGATQTQLLLLLFTKWRPQRRKSTSGFWFGHVWHLRTSKEIGVPNFDQILQSAAVILLLLVSENKRPPYLNSTSGFDFDLFTVIGIWFCIGLPNFIQIGWSPMELWHHIDFTRWRP